mmetsp:Transcript_13923/g.35095  ORF Transcript_13923/g.35095 Transcript_13923/m.35095 type:complete len:214 (+) Transcript_13923:333-974(+)
MRRHWTQHHHRQARARPWALAMHRDASVSNRRSSRPWCTIAMPQQRRQCRRDRVSHAPQGRSNLPRDPTCRPCRHRRRNGTPHWGEDVDPDPANRILIPLGNSRECLPALSSWSRATPLAWPRPCARGRRAPSLRGRPSTRASRRQCPPRGASGEAPGSRRAHGAPSRRGRRPRPATSTRPRRRPPRQAQPHPKGKHPPHPSPQESHDRCDAM